MPAVFTRIAQLIVRYWNKIPNFVQNVIAGITGTAIYEYIQNGDISGLASYLWDKISEANAYYLEVLLDTYL